MAKFSECFSIDFWKRFFASSDDEMSSVERVQAKITAQRMKVEDYRKELDTIERSIRESVRCKDMVSAKSMLRKKKSTATLLFKAEHSLGVLESILANIEEIADVRDTADIVVAVQREYKHVNVDRLYRDVARASDGLTSIRESVGETNQVLAGNSAEPVFDESALDAELAAYLDEPASHDISSPLIASGRAWVEPPVQEQRPVSEIERIYSRYMIPA